MRFLTAIGGKDLAHGIKSMVSRLLSNYTQTLFNVEGTYGKIKFPEKLTEIIYGNEYVIILIRTKFTTLSFQSLQEKDSALMNTS